MGLGFTIQADGDGDGGPFKKGGSKPNWVSRYDQVLVFWGLRAVDTRNGVTT